MKEEQGAKENLFQNIFEFHTAVQLIVDPSTGYIVDANRAAEKFYGWSKEQLVHMCNSDINILPPGELKEAINKVQKRKQNQFEFQHRLADNSIKYVQVFSCEIEIKGEKLLHSIIHDITDRKKAEEDIKLNEARLESLLKINQHPTNNIQELLDFALEEAITLTGSKIGYIYFYDEGKKEFTLNSWSKEVMHQCTVTKPQTIYELDKTGIWGEAVRQRKPVLINKFEAPNPLKKGVPEGYAPLNKFLTIPVFSNDKIVAVVGVANKTTDYNESDVRQLNLMMDAVWKVVQRLKSEEIIKQSESRLQRAELASKSGNWELYLDTMIIYASEGAMKIYGVADQQIPYELIENIPLPEYRLALDEAFNNLINNEENYNIEFKIKRLIDDEIVDIHSNAIYDKEKRIIFGTIQDITERKQMEAAVRESAAKYRALIESSNDVVFCVDKDGYYQFVNQIFASTFNKTPEFFYGKSFWDIYPKEHADYRFEASSKVFETGEPGSVEVTVPLENKILYYLAKTNPIKDDSGKVILNLTTAIDITERKQAEEALKESEEKFRTLFTQMAEGFALHEVIYDETQTAIDYRIVDVNPAFEKLVGISYDKVIGALASELYGTSPAPFLELYAQVAKTGKYHAFENYVATMDQYFDISVFSPKKGFFATIFSDITESKHSDEKLKEEQLFNQTLIENLPGIFNLYTYPDIKLVRWNKNHETMFGYTPVEHKDMFSRDWTRPEVKERILAEMRKVHDLGFVQREMNLYRKGGADIPFLINSVKLETKNQTYIMGVGIDITLRKKAFEALRESELQLKDLNATKDKFFSIIAHDLKSPFNSILGLSNLLVEQIKANNFDGIEEYADIIQNSSKRAMDLLLNLLEWSRSQTGRMEFNPEYIELVSIINEVTDLLNESAQQKSITILKELPPKVIAYADRAMISTILRNLLSNAIKFTNIGGTIRIVVVKNKNELRVSVTDDGVGIAPEDIKKLFKLEENHTTLGTKNEKGTGLGLILCKEFIEKNGGRIWAESEFGKESTFYFTIPSSNMM